MFKPYGNFVFVIDEKRKESSIVKIDGTKPLGKIFIVVDVGIGYYDNGILIKPEVEIGDRVCYVGESVLMPIEGNEVWCLPASQIIAYERKETKE